MQHMKQSVLFFVFLTTQPSKLSVTQNISHIIAVRIQVIYTQCGSNHKMYSTFFKCQNKIKVNASNLTFMIIV